MNELRHIWISERMKIYVYTYMFKYLKVHVYAHMILKLSKFEIIFINKFSRLVIYYTIKSTFCRLTNMSTITIYA